MLDPVPHLRNIIAFLDNVVANYTKSKIFVLSPIWRTDCEEMKKSGPFLGVEAMIKKACENRSNISFISGFSLVPPCKDCFGDLFVHPNETGFDFYYKNLLEFIKKSNI